MTGPRKVRQRTPVTRQLPAWCRVVREPLSDAEKAILEHKGFRIREPKDIVDLLTPRLSAEEVEVFYVVTLDAQSRVLNLSEVTRGLVNASLVHPRETFRQAIADNAAGIIVAHNHPSGEVTPSSDDRSVTKQLSAAAKLLDIPLYDHVIVGGTKYFSFAESGIL